MGGSAYIKTAMVIYRSQMHATLKRNYQLMPALKWLRLLLYLSLLFIRLIVQAAILVYEWCKPPTRLS